MKNILISGTSGIIGYGILRSLKLSNENLKLIGTTIYSDSVALDGDGTAQVIIKYKVNTF